MFVLDFQQHATKLAHRKKHVNGILEDWNADGELKLAAAP
jgi:hypothetical protein